jgi:protein-disulfide isomerase
LEQKNALEGNLADFFRKASYGTALLISGVILAGASLPAKTHSQAKTRRRAVQKAVAKEVDPVKTYGSRSAPITMEVYSDFQCPSCRGLYEQTLRPLINDYVAAGKVYLIHRDFPLPMHPYSFEAARWATAAAEIGRFAEVEAALYDNQPAWSADGNVRKYVAEALSSAEMKRVEMLMVSCHGAPAVGGCPLDGWIEKDVTAGRAIPVQQTPTSFVIYRGQRYPVVGVVTYPILKQFLDSLLRQ